MHNPNLITFSTDTLPPRPDSLAVSRRNFSNVRQVPAGQEASRDWWVGAQDCSRAGTGAGSWFPRGTIPGMTGGSEKS